MAVVYLVRTEVVTSHEQEWLRWQDEEHIANLLTLPGYRGVQRFSELDCEGNYLNIWRLDGRSAQASEQYRAASLTPWFDRIRPHYEVTVEFSVEADDRAAAGDALWRSNTGGVVVDRYSHAAGPSVERHEEELAAAAGVAQVVRLDPLHEQGRPDPRSAPSTVLLIYTAAGMHDVALPSAAGVERRRYRAMSKYLPALSRGAD